MNVFTCKHRCALLICLFYTNLWPGFCTLDGCFSVCCFWSAHSYFQTVQIHTAAVFTECLGAQFWTRLKVKVEGCLAEIGSSQTFNIFLKPAATRHFVNSLDIAAVEGEKNQNKENKPLTQELAVLSSHLCHKEWLLADALSLLFYWGGTGGHRHVFSCTTKKKSGVVGRSCTQSPRQDPSPGLLGKS